MRETPLSAEQAAAVRCGAHALEIRAGAGTGKTHTLAHRVAHLAPTLPLQSRCLVVTFTRDATQNLHRRLSLLLGRDHAVRVLSFHQWAARELPAAQRRFLAQDEARRIIHEALLRARPGAGFARALGVALGEDVTARVLGVLSYAKNAETSLGAALDGPIANLAPWRDALETIQETYEARKADRLDYDDLLVAFRDHLARDATLRRNLVARLDHIFVDEYQDVNGLQAEAVRLVSAGRGGARVTVVGDARQSIYGFRGGAPRHLDQFLAAYGAKGKRLALSVNFRSDRGVVAASNRALPSPWPLRARRGAPRGVVPEVLACADPRAEGRLLADRCESLLAEGADPREIVVLGRARHLGLAFQEEVVARRADETWAADHPDAMSEAIDRYLRANRKLRVGLDAFAAEATGDAARASRILARRARAAPPLPTRHRADRLLSLPRGEDLFHVKVATIHAAKGLEWDHVFLAGAREGGLPSEHALRAPEHVRDEMLAEERRLLYVALTRARKTFVATWPQQGERREHEACRWIAALGPTDEDRQLPSTPAGRAPGKTSMA